MIDKSKIITYELRKANELLVVHSKIQEWRDEQEKKNITFNYLGRVWDGGKKTRERLQPVLALAELPQGFFWTDHNNEDVVVNLADLQELNTAHETAIVFEGFKIHSLQRQMKAMIQDMNLEELKNFNPVSFVSSLVN